MKAFSPDATEPSEEDRKSAAERLGVKDREAASDDLWRFVGRLGQMFD